MADENFQKTMAAAKGELDRKHQLFEGLVKPLSSGYERLNPQIEQLAAQVQSVTAETAKLAGALSDNRRVGQWGEIQLRRVVELAGMAKHCDFVEQPTSEGSQGRPDMVVKLPNGRAVVVDAKASTSAFLEARTASDDAAAKDALDRHAKGLKRQLDSLAKKNYGASVTGAVDFVVMFVPGDQFLSADSERRRGSHNAHDLAYARDLGLLALDLPPRIANPIYQVVPRELGYVLQDSLDQNSAWYVDDAGGLHVRKLLTAFATFFGEHAERWLDHLGDYREAGPQLILQAYLQRVVNGGGRIEREYGLGRGRTDLLVLWPREAGLPSDLWQRFVIECKVLRNSDRKSLEGTIERGVEQTLGYMKKCGAEEGHLVVFDRRDGAEAQSPASEAQDGGQVVVWTL